MQGVFVSGNIEEITAAFFFIWFADYLLIISSLLTWFLYFYDL